MPCCSWVLSIVASSSGGAGTPSWLHRLHAKGGLSFPKDLQIDDLLYGGSRSPAQPAAAAAAPHPPPAAPLPPPPTPAAAATPQAPPPKPNPTRTTPARPNPSAATNTDKPALPQQPPTPPPPLSGVVSDIFAFAVPSAPRSTRLLKPFRKQSRPRPCSDDEGDDKTPRSSTKENKNKKETKTKGRKRRRAERDAALAATANGTVERNSKTDVTVIDSSTEGWKGSKVLHIRGLSWKVQNKKVSLVAEPETLAKGKRRAGLVAKITRDREKERKAAASQGNIAISGDLVKEPDGATEMLKRPRSSEPAPGGRTAAPFLLPSTSTLSQP